MHVALCWVPFFPVSLRLGVVLLWLGVLYSLRMVWCRCTISTSYLIQYVSLLEKILIIIFVSIYCIKGCLLLIIILVDKPAGQNDLYLCKFTY
jgi:hypothetical protein